MINDYLDSLENDLNTINTTLGLPEGTNFSDISTMCEDGDITTGGPSIEDYFYEVNSRAASYYDYDPLMWTSYVKKLPSNISLQNGTTSLKYAFKYFFGNELNLSNFDTRNVTNMSQMFYKSNVANFIVGQNFSIQSATDLSYMFQCSCATTLDLPFLGETPCTNFAGMFGECPYLTSLNIRNLKSTANSSINITSMFINSTHLTFIDVRSFEFSKCSTALTQVFGTNSNFGPPNNCLIIVKDDTEKSYILNNGLNRFTNIKTVEEYEASLNS